MKKMIVVEVAYALPDRQSILELQVEEGTTAHEAVVASGITELYPEIDLESAQMGVFSQMLGSRGLAPAREYILQPRDRVEIYRPLTVDPKEVRRKRAEQAKAAKQ